MNPNEIHIDLLRCEHCGQHNKLLLFCSACGRARTKVIIAQPHEYKLDRPAPFRCPVCYSQRRTTPKCVYCDLKMPVNRKCEGWEARLSDKEREFLSSKSSGTPEIFPEKAKVRRIMEQRYVDGAIRYVYVDTGKPVDDQKPLPSAVKAKYREPTPKRRTLVYQRDGGCIRCGRASGLTLHHITHRSKGGNNLPSNLQTLCSKCHAYIHDELKVPSGTPYSHSLEPDPLTQEEEDREWNRIRRERAAKHGKKPGSYTYGKGLATNLAAPEIARLRKR